jgi:uncharacterized protein DUF6941
VEGNTRDSQFDSEQGLEGRPRIDSFLAADWAEAINGKLYVMGAGFEMVFAPQFPWAVRFSFGAVLAVPWADTNRRFPIEGKVETTDGEDLGWNLSGEVEAGRAPGRRATDVRIVAAGPVQFQVDAPVDFVLKLRFAGDQRAIPLQVTAPPFPIMAMPPPGG